MADNKRTNQNILHTMTLAALLIGTVGSLYFMFNTGSNQKSIILIGLFTAWVTSPFVGLFVALRLTKHWTGIIHSWFYFTALLLVFVAVTAYSRLLTFSDTKPAFNFVVIPFFSWLVILLILLSAKRQKLK